MGRRALRKIDPQLDLSWHLVNGDQVPVPCTPESLFGEPGPWELEVGSGKGLFLENAARSHPDVRFLGVEISGKYARFAAARLVRAQLRNARLVHGDAMELIGEKIPSSSLRAVHVYFPDPWWKKRHHKRRIMNATFVGHVQRVLQPDGRFHFWTDVREYFDESVQLIQQTTELEGPLEVRERPAEHDMDYRTHFERRVRLVDLPVYRAEFRKSLSAVEQ